jgi:hypothetical protein
VNPAPGYAVSADGQRFLIMTQAEELHPSPVTVVTNWIPDRKEN